MKKALLCVVVISLLLQVNTPYANADTGVTDSSGLSDIVIKLLMPEIQKSVDSFYSPYLTTPPIVAPYYGTKIVGMKDSELSVEVFPYVGPHISVGKDRITFDISNPGEITVKEFKHIESYVLPPHRQSILKKPLP